VVFSYENIFQKKENGLTIRVLLLMKVKKFPTLYPKEISFYHELVMPILRSSAQAAEASQRFQY